MTDGQSGLRDRHFLVRTPNWLGDAVMSLPAVRAIKERAGRLTIMAPRFLWDLYEGVADVTVDAKVPLREAVATIKRVRPDTAILFQNSLYSAIVQRLGGCRDIWGYRTGGRGQLLSRPVNPPRDIYQSHQLYYHWNLAVGLGMAGGEPRMVIEPRGESLLDRSSAWIGMGPGARYGEAKRWAASSYAITGRVLAAKGFRIALFGAETEAGNCDRVAHDIGPAALNLAGRTTIRQLIASIARCRVFVSNDSGTQHLASAAGVPVVAIFGSTEPRSTAPFNRPSTVLRRALPCSPCHRRVCPIDHRCMTRIHPEEVVSAAMRMAALSPLHPPAASSQQE